MRSTLTCILVVAAVAAVFIFGWPKAATVGASHNGTSATPTAGTPVSPSAAVPVPVSSEKSFVAPPPTASAPPVVTDAAGKVDINIDPTSGQARLPHSAPKAGEVRTLSIRELGNFSYDPVQGGDVPKDIHALDGMKVRINGFIFPMNNAEFLTDFVLVPSLTSCCFGQPPGVQHIITTRIPKEKAIAPEIDEVVVEGTLHVHVNREDDYTTSIFELDATSVKLAQ